jgi:hypothetical protein
VLTLTLSGLKCLGVFAGNIECLGVFAGKKISEGRCPPYMREEECRLLSWGSLLLLLLVLDLCYALGGGGVATITVGRISVKDESFQGKTRQTESQPVMSNNDLCVEFMLFAVDF